MQAQLPVDRLTSRAPDEMTGHPQPSITSYLHTASRVIIDLLVREGVGTLVIGKNDRWKQRVGLG